MDLPVEIIERILLHISKFNVLTLNTVSQQFNDVISGSVHLMDRVCLHWSVISKMDIEKVLKSSRKYRIIAVEDFDEKMDEQLLLQFIAKNSKTLKLVTLKDNAFRKGTVGKIIEKVGGNLIELKLELQLQNVPEVATFNVPNLKKFHCTLQDEQSSEYLMMLLKNLKGLEALYLENCKINGQELQIIIAVEAQKLTLESCSCEWNGSVALVGSHRLEELTMSTPKTRSSEVDEDMIQQIVKTCPNVTTIFVEWMTIGFETSLILATTAKNLKHLRVEYCKIDPITFPTIETYETYGGDIDDAIRLIRINRQLKKVKIDHLVEHEASFQRALLENPGLDVELV